MNTNYLSLIPVALVALLLLAFLYQRQAPRKRRCFLASLLEAAGVLGGAVAGGVIVTAGGFPGFLLRLAVFFAVAAPVLCLATYLRRRGHAA
jgi:uncharacterized membrane protein